MAVAPAVEALLGEIVEALPLGLAVSRDGAALYANRFSRALDAQAAMPDKAARDGAGADPIERVAYRARIDGRDFDVALALDVAHHRLAEAELTRRAFYDDLTGLPKRDLFEHTLRSMIAEGCAPFALAFIDIDNFKFVNDYHGHGVGDRLLAKVVRRIGDEMRPSDVLARVGGDEFVLMTTPLTSPDVPGPEIERLSQRFREPFFIDGHEIFTSASIGVSLYPAHGRCYEVLRANADAAMYRVKETTKGGVCLFDASLGHAATKRMESEQRLRLAIRDKRITCAFQPKVDFRADTIVGCEVLLRWQDENGEIRAPGEILKLAIELGLMDDIALMVLERVTEQIDEINDAFGPGSTISLNVAARQAGDSAFMARFLEALAATGYPQRFILELTEEAFVSGNEFQARILPTIRAIGAKVSIDDFGVGYSSLSTLAEITADEIKVDRCFITDIHRKPRNQSILKMIELLGQALGMRITVEGVETHEELAYLMAATRINCAQGFYFAKPLFLQPLTRTSPRALRAAGARGRR